jgi:hypothetical protein
MTKRLILYPFRCRHPAKGKWTKARYLAEQREIEARHSECEIVGPPEIREVDEHATYFHPCRTDRAPS